MLAESIEIRTQLLALIDYNTDGDYINWVKSMCVIVKSLIYFDSSSAALDPNIDPTSPYY